jgi:DNA (cytosine-5)-methyltransferase 1
VVGTLNSGGNRGGFRSEPGEHLAVNALDQQRGRADGNAAQAGHLVCAHDTGQGWWNESDVAGTLRAEGENRPSRPSNVVVPLDMRLLSRGERMTNNRPDGVAAGGAPGTGIGQAGDPAPGIGLSHPPAVAFAFDPKRDLAPHGSSEMRPVCSPLTATDYKDPQVIAFSSKDDGRDAGPLSPTLRSMNFDKSHMNGGGQVAVAFQERGREGGAPGTGIGSIGDPSPTVAIDHTPAVGFQGSSTMLVRRLLPVECERLMGFPDSWTALGYDGKQISDSARYRMLGNSVAVPCVEWIARRIVAAHKNATVGHSTVT